MDVRLFLLCTVSITVSPARISRAVSRLDSLRHSVPLTAMIVIPASTRPCNAKFAGERAAAGKGREGVSGTVVAARPFTRQHSFSEVQVDGNHQFHVCLLTVSAEDDPGVTRVITWPLPSKKSNDSPDEPGCDPVVLSMATSVTRYRL